MMLLFTSLALLLSVFMMVRGFLLWGTARWHEEQAFRRADVLRGSPQDWKRVLLAVVGHTFAPPATLPAVAKYQTRLHGDNIAAGNPWNMTEGEILALAELCFVGVTLFAWIGMLLLMGRFNLLSGLIAGICTGIIPGYIIRQKSVQRRLTINRALPFALDLLVLSMEAGSSFLESIQILVDSEPSNPLSQEFSFFLQAVRYGKTRAIALTEMAERIRSDDLTRIVDAINTGEELGTPVGKILRIQAEGTRAARSQRAEKLAAEASSKILFPTLLIMVAVLLMLMGPVIIKAVRGDWF